MKKRNFILFLVIACVFLAFIWFDVFEGTFSERERREMKREQAQTEVMQQKAALEKEKGRTLTDEEVLGLLPVKARNYIEVGRTMNQQAITFYGQVMDQHNKPIQEGVIQLSLGANGFSGGKRMRIKTDQQGRFSLENVKGSRLIFHGIEHPNVENFKRYNKVGQVMPGRIFHGFQPYQGANKLIWKGYTTLDKAYVFKVWRKGASEGAIENKGWIHFANDRDVSYIDLVSEKVDAQLFPGAQFKVTAFTEPADGRTNQWGKSIHRYPRDWWVEFEPINAGVQEVPEGDVFFNLAPESGYSSKVIRYEANKTDDNYKYKVIRKRHYIKANDNSYYGYIYIEALSPVREGNTTDIRYQIKLNPNGSRNLEYFKP